MVNYMKKIKEMLFNRKEKLNSIELKDLLGLIVKQKEYEISKKRRKSKLDQIQDIAYQENLNKISTLKENTDIEHKSEGVVIKKTNVFTGVHLHDLKSNENCVNMELSKQKEIIKNNEKSIIPHVENIKNPGFGDLINQEDKAYCKKQVIENEDEKEAIYEQSKKINFGFEAGNNFKKAIKIIQKDITTDTKESNIFNDKPIVRKEKNNDNVNIKNIHQDNSIESKGVEKNVEENVKDFLTNFKLELEKVRNEIEAQKYSYSLTSVNIGNFICERFNYQYEFNIEEGE